MNAIHDGRCASVSYLDQTAQFLHHEDQAHANGPYYHNCDFHYAARADVGDRITEARLDHVFIDHARHGIQSGRHCTTGQRASVT